MTVWESLDALAEYVYGGLHLQVMRRRREWFSHLRESFSVAWWVPTGVRPTVADAEDRLDALRRHGPTPYAFTLQRAFPPPGSRVEQLSDDRWSCPA